MRTMNPFTMRPPRLKGFDYSAERMYFVTMCTKNRVPAFADPKIAEIAKSVIMRYRSDGRYYMYAYCIMPDHIHLLLKLRAGNGRLDTLIAVIKSGIRHGASPQAEVSWMRGFHERIKRDYEDAHEFVRYIRLNPVRAGMVAEAHDYPFSGAPDPWC